MGYGFGIGFDIIETIVPLLFLLVFGIMIVSIVRGIAEWNKNNQSPQLTVPATLVAKRTNVTRHRSAGEHHHYHTSTTYYATFQVESGDRMEFSVSGTEYGMLAEGDRGRLSFQGTRYLGFERMVDPT